MEGSTSYLVITRPGNQYRDALRAYSIEVDGEDRGSVRAGETLTIEVPAGSHEVRASIDWTGSPAVAIDARAGEQVWLVVEPAGSASTALFQLFRPTSYLALRVMEDDPPAPSPTDDADESEHMR